MQKEHRSSCLAVLSRQSAIIIITVCATGYVNKKGQFSTPYRIDTPQLITKKYVTGDYIGDPYSQYLK